jgi:hypothetical protein
MDRQGQRRPCQGDHSENHLITSVELHGAG